MNIFDIIQEELMDIKYKYIPIDFEFDEELDEMGLDIYDLSDQAENIAKDSNINILRNKELVGIILDLNTNTVAGALWTNTDNDEFSFDIVVNNRYRNKRLSYTLIDKALEEYDYKNDMYMDYKNTKLPMNVEVVNPLLVNILKNKYNFKIINKINNTTIMSK